MKFSYPKVDFFFQFSFTDESSLIFQHPVLMHIRNFLNIVLLFQMTI